MISNKFNSIRSIINNNISSFKLYSPITIRNNKLINNRLFNSSLITTHSTSTSTSTSTTTSTSKINKISYFNNNGRSSDNNSIKLNNNTNHNILNNRYFTTTTEESTDESTDESNIILRQIFKNLCRLNWYQVIYKPSELIELLRSYQYTIIELCGYESNIDRYDCIILYWNIAAHIFEELNKNNTDKSLIVYNNISMEEVEQVWKIMNIGPNSNPYKLDPIRAFIGFAYVREFKYINSKLVQLAVKEYKSLSEKDRQKLIENRGSKFFKVLTEIAFINGLWQEGVYLKSLFGSYSVIDMTCFDNITPWINILDSGILSFQEIKTIYKIITNSKLQSAIPSEFLFDYNCYQPPTDDSLTSHFNIKSFGKRDLITKDIIGDSKKDKLFNEEGLSAREIVELNYVNYNLQTGYYEQDYSNVDPVSINSRIVKMKVKLGNQILSHIGMMNHDFTKCVLVGLDTGVLSVIACDVRKTRIGDCEYSIQLDGSQRISLHTKKENTLSTEKLRVNLETIKSTKLPRFKPVNV